MNVPEHTPIIEDGVSPAINERQQPSTSTNQTADPSARTEVLGRDDKPGPNAGAPPLPPAVGDKVGATEDYNPGASKPVNYACTSRKTGTSADVPR